MRKRFISTTGKSIGKTERPQFFKNNIKFHDDKSCCLQMRVIKIGVRRFHALHKYVFRGHALYANRVAAENLVRFFRVTFDTGSMFYMSFFVGLTIRVCVFFENVAQWFL